MPPAVKRRRAERLRALSDRLGRERRAGARSGSATACSSSAWTPHGRLHGYGADYTAYELRAHAGAAVGDLVEVVLEAAGRAGCTGEGAVIERIDKDVKTAMKSGDAERRDALRLVLLVAARRREGRARGRSPRTRRRPCCGASCKRRREAAEAFRDAGHEERAAAEESEAALIEGYLPAQLSDEELEVIVESAVAKVGATSPREMGQVMREAMAMVAGRADGKRVQERVRARLAQ